MPDRIDQREGRRLFGLNPEGYDAARPRYPDALYAFMQGEGAIGVGTRTLEIGAGTGIATRRLLALGAHPITVVEPDARFAPSLRALGAIDIVHMAFEDFRAPDASFDLVAAATAFHWVEPAVGAPKLAALLRPGGWAALWWNVLQDLDRGDAFHEATHHVLRDLAVSPTGAPNTLPFALDRPAREADFGRTGAFAPARYFETRWTHVLDTTGVRALYEGFSHIQRLDEGARERVLDSLTEIADHEFAGRVERNVTSVIYLFRRNAR
jgi:SAM-dependent methyltransferase